MRVPGEAERGELLELGCDASELVDFPRWRVVVIDESEESLFLATAMAVECPGKCALRADEQAKVGVHAAAAGGAVEATAPGGELVEPNWCGKVALNLE